MTGAHPVTVAPLVVLLLYMYMRYNYHCFIFIHVHAMQLSLLSHDVVDHDVTIDCDVLRFAVIALAWIS